MTIAPPAPTNDELVRLEILRYFKRRFSGDGTRNRSPFEDHQVIRYGTRVETWDVPEIHQEVRDSIQEIVTGIRDGARESQVVILAGEPGMGKTHLLNYFRVPERAEELGYLFLCNSNHWKVDEFESCLLDWMLDTLTGPSRRDGTLDAQAEPPPKKNLLLRKIHDIAFQALSQLLTKPGQIQPYIQRWRAGWWSRLWNRFTRRWPGAFQEAVASRDAEVFRVLDFGKFADFVGQRFLHEPGNPYHRYVLRVLLRYLFPEDRELVIGWLRRRRVADEFLKILGVSDSIDQQYKIIDTIKILISLFTTDVEKHLSPDARPGRMFFFAFDQIEGRQELFDRDADWFKFFAQLSELYNALPNVFIMFTMTNLLRDQLYPKMERQFKHRISRDPKFVLREPKPEEYLAIYRRHLQRWLGEPDPDLAGHLQDPRHQFEPFSAAQVAELCKRKTLREALGVLDQSFRREMLGTIVDPRYDYLVAHNEFAQQEANVATNAYTDSHLETVTELLNRHGGALAGGFRMVYAGMEGRATADQVVAVRLEFRHPERDSLWVRLNLVVLPYQYKSRLDGCFELVANYQKDRNFLLMVRADNIDAELDKRRPNQAFARKLKKSAQTTFRAMLHLLEKQERYTNDDWKKAEGVLLDEFRKTYLGRMFQFLSETLEHLKSESGKTAASPAEVSS